MKKEIYIGAPHYAIALIEDENFRSKLKYNRYGFIKKKLFKKIPPEYKAEYQEMINNQKRHFRTESDWALILRPYINWKDKQIIKKYKKLYQQSNGKQYKKVELYSWGYVIFDESDLKDVIL